jgi:hypothetical protein
VAVARIERSGNSFYLDTGSSGEDPAYAAKIAALPGIRGFVPLNRVALTGSVKSYRELDVEAQKVGADLLAVYRFETQKENQDAFVPLSVLSLGLAPTVGHTTTTVVTLIIRDARTGYIYGIMEERAESKGLTLAMDIQNANQRGQRKTRKEAMDRLMDRLPGFWNGVLAKGR